MKLRMSPDLSLPDDVAGEAIGVLATRGAGKSYSSAVLVEELHRSHVQTAVLDPTGVYWGLRAGAAGQSGGLPIVVLGGAHGDVALEPTAGKLIADLLVDTGQSLILDLSDFESKGAQTRFVTDLAERLYARKARARSTLHLVVDEGQEFAPQKPMRDEARMLGAMERLVGRGRSRGIGTTLITQRSATLNKNVLDLIDTLVVMRMGSPRDRKAVEGWITAKDERDELGVLDSLPALPTGTAWVWSPVRGILKKVAVRRIRTFDSYATPKPGHKKKEPRVLAPIDLSKLGEQITATADRAKAEDPRELHKRIRDLERQLATTSRVSAPAEVVVERVEVPVPVLPNGQVKAVQEVTAELVIAGKRIERVGQEIGQAIQAWVTRIPTGPQTGVAHHAGVRAPAPAQASAEGAGRGGPTLRKTAGGPVRDRPPPPDPGGTVDVHLRLGARRMLDVLARHHPMRMTRAQLGTLAKVKRTGGTFSDYFSKLRTSGLILEEHGLVEITPAGFDVVGSVPAAPMSVGELREVYRRALRAGARRMLDVLIEAYPEWMSRQELADRAEITMTGGTFSDYLSSLRTNGLADVHGGEVRASETLFIGAGA